MRLLLPRCSRGSWEQAMLLEALSYFWRLRKVSERHLPFLQKLSREAGLPVRASS